jgi:hypothetical protein
MFTDAEIPFFKGLEYPLSYSELPGTGRHEIQEGGGNEKHWSLGISVGIIV